MIYYDQDWDWDIAIDTNIAIDIDINIDIHKYTIQARVDPIQSVNVATNPIC